MSENEKRDGFRKESDSLGDVWVFSEKYWGAQTQRSIQNFAIGHEKMPLAVIHALALVKRVAVSVNMKQNRISSDEGTAVIRAAEEVMSGKFDSEFPLSVWQSGAGTPSNMNVNEVIANRANELLGKEKGGRYPVHPNDTVNLSQSTNDSFPTAMHICVREALDRRLLPALQDMHAELLRLSEDHADLIKVGRTHLQDAVPMTLGQEFSAFATSIKKSIEKTKRMIDLLGFIPQGGTAVGTGLGSHKGFATLFAHELSILTGKTYKPAENLFEAVSSVETMVDVSAMLSTCGSVFIKIGGDIRLLASGPRCGLGELQLPENEPGSSIMPGKINPTQTEPMTMIGAHVIGNHTTITLLSAQGTLQLNTFKTGLIYNLLDSIELLSDVARSFTQNCLSGLQPRREQIAAHLENSLMLVTALREQVGYDKAAEIARRAYLEGKTLKEVAVGSAFLSAAEYDAAMFVNDMVKPHE